MQLNPVPALTGIQWMKTGLRIFWRQPFGLVGIFFLFMMTVSVLGLIPWIGGVLALLLMPGLQAGLVAASEDAENLRFPMPQQLFAGFRQGPELRKRLLTLGAYYALGLALVLGISALLDGGEFARIYLGMAPISEDLLRSETFASTAWVGLLLHIPLLMVFWHAPALLLWQPLSPAQSLFYSWMACWRNKGAFFLYAMAWLTLFLAISLIALMVGHTLGLNPTALVMPAGLFVAAAMYASVPTTVKGSFR